MGNLPETVTSMVATRPETVLISCSNRPLVRPEFRTLNQIHLYQSMEPQDFLGESPYTLEICVARTSNQLRSCRVLFSSISLLEGNRSFSIPMRRVETDYHKQLKRLVTISCKGQPLLGWSLELQITCKTLLTLCLS